MVVLSCNGLADITLWPKPVTGHESIALSCLEKREVEELGGLLAHSLAETPKPAFRCTDNRHFETLLAEYPLELS